MAERRQEGVHRLQREELSQAQIVRELGGERGCRQPMEEKNWIKETPKRCNPIQAGGRPPKLDEVTRQNLVQKLEAGALAAGFSTEQ